MSGAIESFSHDFSAYFFDLDLSESPADGYFNIMRDIFGENPTRQEAIAVYEDRMSELTKALNNWSEVEFSEELVKKATYIALKNWFGFDKSSE